MNRPVDVINALEETSSRLEKEAIIEQAWANGIYEFFDGCRLAFDSLITFGVKKVPLIEDSDDGLTFDYSYDTFRDLAEKLSVRKLTGNNARDALHEHASQCATDEWNKWYRRILIKDLRCGVSETTVNKILRKVGKTDKRALDYIVDVWQVQLATATELETLSGTYLADPKLDGIRLTTVVDVEKNTVIMYTRNGKINENFDYITNSFMRLIPHLPGSLVFDGEVVSENFQKLMTQVNRKKSVNTKDAKYALFDIIPLEEFKKGMSPKEQDQRHEVLANMEPMFQQFCRVDEDDPESEQNIYVIPKIEINLDSDEGRKKLSEFNMEVLNAGFEGIMLKDPTAPYERKRTKHWLKVKPVIEVTLTITDVEIGTGRNASRLGNLICEGFDLGHKIKVSVGSGFSDEQREEFWEHRESIIGEQVEIRADAITQDAGGGDVFSLRFPRFLRFRSIDNGGKI